MKSYLALIVIALLSVQAIAQNCRALPSDKSCDKGWFSIGVGADSEYDLSLLISGNFGRSKFWQANVLTATEFTLGSNKNAAHYFSVSVARGYSSVYRLSRVFLAAGPSLVMGNKPYPMRNKRFTTPGLIINSGINLTPLKEFGIGFNIFGNLNPQLSSYGFTFSFDIEGQV